MTLIRPFTQKSASPGPPPRTMGALASTSSQCRHTFSASETNSILTVIKEKGLPSISQLSVASHLVVLARRFPSTTRTCVAYATAVNVRDCLGLATPRYFGNAFASLSSSFESVHKDESEEEEGLRMRVCKLASEMSADARACKDEAEERLVVFGKLIKLVRNDVSAGPPPPRHQSVSLKADASQVRC